MTYFSPLDYPLGEECYSSAREYPKKNAKTVKNIIKHFWVRLEWICDVAELIRAHGEMDWEQVIGRARELGSMRMLLLGLFLTKDLLGATLPAEIWHRAQADPAVASLAAQVRKRIFGDPDPHEGVSDIFPFHVRVRERLQDRVRYCLRMAVTPTEEEWEFLSLPRPLFSVYYLLRAIRMGRRSGLWLWRRGLRWLNRMRRSPACP